MKAKKKNNNNVRCSFSVDASLAKKLEKMSKNLGKSKSEILREALSSYINYNETDDFSFALDALNELKSGDHGKDVKKLDDVIEKLKR